MMDHAAAGLSRRVVLMMSAGGLETVAVAGDLHRHEALVAQIIECLLIPSHAAPATVLSPAAAAHRADLICSLYRPASSMEDRCWPGPGDHADNLRTAW